MTLIGAISALLGALIGGGATLLGSIYQERSALASQVQSERQTSYVAYNTTTTNFFSDAEIMLTDLKVGFKWRDALGNLTNADVAFARAGGQVIIIASPSLVRIVRVQQHGAELIDLQLQQLAFRVTYPKSPVTAGTPGATALLASLSSELLSFARYQNEFEDVARADLGTGSS